MASTRSRRSLAEPRLEPARDRVGGLRWTICIAKSSLSTTRIRPIAGTWIRTTSRLRTTIRCAAITSRSICGWTSGGIITDARFDGHGCAISQASADLLMESIVGKTVEDVKVMGKQDILDMLGIDLGPVRLKCALLSLKVLKAGVYGLGEARDDLVE